MPHDSESERAHRQYARFYRLAHHLILHSEQALHEFEERFPAIATPRAIIPIGVLFDDVAPVPKADARKRLGWNSDECVIVFLGLIKHYKGLDILLEAVAQAETSKPLRLVIAGSWRFAENRPRYDVLIEQARQRHSVDVEDRIPERDETAAILCGADALIQPYRSASASAPGMTAMRFGTPIIASNAGSFPQMLVGELAQWLVPPGDVTALADAIQRLSGLTDTEHEAVQTAVRERGESEFAWSNIAAKTAQIYDEVDEKVPLRRGI